jgi:hypothetical protein
LDFFGVSIFQMPIWVSVWLVKVVKTDLTDKDRFEPENKLFSNFRPRFGFLMQFCLFPELGLTKRAQDQELLIFGDFLKI